jgi:hypothetical protein
MACPLSLLCEETQLGESGQAGSLPPVTPICEGRLPEQPTTVATRQMNQYTDMAPLKKFIS